MVRYFIYATDYSGSTHGVQFYHDNGLKTVDQFKSEIEKINADSSKSGSASTESRVIYLHWDSECNEVNEKTVVDTYKCLIGSGGTEPVTIIQWIQNNIRIDADDKIELMYIITDGLIDDYSVEDCFELNKDINYEKVVFHGFNEYLDEINLSVAASFLKSRCSVYRNYELLDDTDISEEYDYDKITIDNFETEKENLKSYIKLKYINKFNRNALSLQEIEKLKKLRGHLFAQLSSKSESNVNLDTKDKKVFLCEFYNTNWYKSLTDPAYDTRVDVEKAISSLINYIVNDKKSYAFDALKFKTTYNVPIKEETIDVIDVNFPAEQEIEFPDIILYQDKGIPVILLTEFSLLDKIIFHKTNTSDEVSPASFNKFKSTMDCPLFLLNDPDISESIGYFYTLNVYKQLLQSPTKTEPRTRRPFHGGLVLIDTDEFDKYNDYILSATYFNFKKINYNVGLFYYVLWKNCENKEWMDKNVVEQLKKYVMRRISGTKCRIALSSLPLDPKVTTSLLTALWYCVEISSCIFKDNPQHFVHERLRMYYGIAHCMIEILQYFNYDLDLKSIGKRRDLIRSVMILKKMKTIQEKRYYLLEKVFKKVNGFLVSEIQNPRNICKLNYLKMDHKGMLRDDVTAEVVDLNEYVHVMYYEDDQSVSESGKVVIRLCEKTLRPFFTIDEHTSFYSELVKITKKVSIRNDLKKRNTKITYDALYSLEFDKLLSFYNLFINCVKTLEKYPTLDEYVEYILRKKKFNGSLVTIFPTNVLSRAERVYAIYQDVMSKLDAGKFIEVSKCYINRVERIKAEGVLRFENDDEINEYISMEEFKANVVKRAKKPAKKKQILPIVKSESRSRTVPLWRGRGRRFPQNIANRRRRVFKREPSAKKVVFAPPRAGMFLPSASFTMVETGNAPNSLMAAANGGRQARTRRSRR